MPFGMLFKTFIFPGLSGILLSGLPLPVTNGFYSAFCCSLTYFIFGTSHHISIGKYCSEMLIEGLWDVCSEFVYCHHSLYHIGEDSQNYPKFQWMFFYVLWGAIQALHPPNESYYRWWKTEIPKPASIHDGHTPCCSTLEPVLHLRFPYWQVQDPGRIKQEDGPYDHPTPFLIPVYLSGWIPIALLDSGTQETQHLKYVTCLLLCLDLPCEECPGFPAFFVFFTLFSDLSPPPPRDFCDALAS